MAGKAGLQDTDPGDISSHGHHVNLCSAGYGIMPVII